MSRFEFSTSFVERAELDRSPDDAPLYAVVERLWPKIENHMAAGASTRLMVVSDLVNLLIESEAAKAA